MPAGNIILLNGTSSAGKTTIMKALQHVLDEPYLDAGIDKFLSMLPKQYFDPPLWHDVFEYIWYKDGSEKELLVRAGSIGGPLLSGMHHAIVALARAGNNVVADHVLVEEHRLQECATLLKDLYAFFVGIYCPLEIVEQRERARGDRILGEARGQFNRVHAHGVYDIKVDTSISSPLECAEQIKHRLKTGPSPSAFKVLVNQR